MTVKNRAHKRPVFRLPNVYYILETVLCGDIHDILLYLDLFEKSSYFTKTAEQLTILPVGFAVFDRAEADAGAVHALAEIGTIGKLRVADLAHIQFAVFEEYRIAIAMEIAESATADLHAGSKQCLDVVEGAVHDLLVIDADVVAVDELTVDQTKVDEVQLGVIEENSV